MAKKSQVEIAETTTSTEEVVMTTSTETTETVPVMIDEVIQKLTERTAEPIAETIAEEPIAYNAPKSEQLMKIDPRLISFDHSDNPRNEYGDIEQLKESIKENGIRTPIKVKANGKDEHGNKTYKLIHGFRRLTATMQLIAEGVDIARISAIPVPNTYSETDAMLDHFTENSGKALNALEQAECFNRLLSFGWEQAEIARKCAVTPSYVSQLMKLANAPKSIKDIVRKGQISASLVVKLISKNKEDYAKVTSDIKGALAKIDGNKSNKVTEKTVTANRVSKYHKLIDKDISAMTAKNYEERFIVKATTIQSFIDSLETMDDAQRIDAICAFAIA